MQPEPRADDWLRRLPRPGETCVFCHPYAGFLEHQAHLVPLWKRDALLFDRVHAQCLDPAQPPDIPLQLSFGIRELDQAVWQQDATMGNLMAQAFAGMDPAEVARLINAGQFEVPAEAFDFEGMRNGGYRRIGVMAEWSYSESGPYLRRFTDGEHVAYEGALNNLPIVDAAGTPWEQIIEFREDPEAVRKYRDLRLWLRSGLGAHSVGHATDIIGQKIENYRWSIHKHGLQSGLGVFTQLLDWHESRMAVAAAGVAAVAGGPVWAAIAGGVAIAAQVSAMLVERRIRKDDVMRGPNSEVAILYEAQERFGA